MIASNTTSRRIRVDARWLNITHVRAFRLTTHQGIETPDSKIFMCEVCVARGTPSEQCNTANFTLKIAGAPPKVLVNSSKYYSTAYA